MRIRWIIFVLCIGLQASVVGMNTPAPSLTKERVKASLPPAEQKPWLEYLQRSAVQMASDKRAFAAERKEIAETPARPAQGNSARSIPLEKDAAFYTTVEARHIADVIVSFQTPSGGWSKNLDMTKQARARGQSYTQANLAPVTSPGEDFDKAADENWHYVGTLDNDATNTELHFLARVTAAMPGEMGEAYRQSFLRGIGYLLDAQYPNGGWPQVWPLEGGYHDAITFNDDAVTESAEMLGEVARGDESFVPAALRVHARIAVASALRCILRTQLRVPTVDGKGTVLAVWAQQHDALTLQPVAARNFESPALSSGESASVMEYLMSLPHPSPAVKGAVEAAAAWFLAHEVRGYRWTGGRNTPGGRKLVAEAGAGPIWARYYSLTTGKPIFADRDRTIHDDVMELSLERRNGYAWYGEEPAKALQQYESVWAPRFVPGVAAQ